MWGDVRGPVAGASSEEGSCLDRTAHASTTVHLQPRAYGHTPLQVERANPHAV